MSISSNGQIITAIAQVGGTNSIYISSDYGATWSEVSPGGDMPINGWNTVFVTASGNKVYALNQNGQLWVLKTRGIQGGSFDSITLQYRGPLFEVDDAAWLITNMTGNTLRNY
jgi:hypothetical protein